MRKQLSCSLDQASRVVGKTSRSSATLQLLSVSSCGMPVVNGDPSVAELISLVLFIPNAVASALGPEAVLSVCGEHGNTVQICCCPSPHCGRESTFFLQWFASLFTCSEAGCGDLALQARRHGAGVETTPLLCDVRKGSGSA